MPPPFLFGVLSWRSTTVCAADRAVDGTPTDSGNDRIPCDGENCRFKLNLTVAQSKAYAAGHVQVLTDLQTALGAEKENAFLGAVSTFKTINLPRQARDKHREALKKEARFPQERAL